MKKYHLLLSAVYFLLFFFFIDPLSAEDEHGLYSKLNNKTWSQILEENIFRWRPPYTINLLINPTHSPDWIYVNPSMTVSRRRVLENISNTDTKQREKANSQNDLVVQFAFDDPAFVPDFRLTKMKLEENKYPIVTLDYYANDLYYKIEYAATSLDNSQTLLDMKVFIKNESVEDKEAHVRTKIGYYPENKIFDYHYIPYRWNSSKWLPYEGISMKNHLIYNHNQLIGKVSSESMDVEWEDHKQYTDEQYESILYPHVWYGSGYALPEFRLHNIQDVIHSSKKLQAGDSTEFSLCLLVNEDKITDTHRDLIQDISYGQVKSQAVNDFKKMFSDKTLSVNFPTGNWDDILTAQQISISQLLIKFPNKETFQPSQGGCSERFFVWVFEAVQMLKPMLKAGRFEDVKKALDYIFALQDAGFPPVGKFTTTKGAIGTTGPRWANTTGMALGLASEYYLYSKDKEYIELYMPKILKAMHWIAGEIKATRVMNSDGTRPLTYGIMPMAVASDGDYGNFVSATDVFTFWGFNKAVQLLETFGHSEAKTMREELEQYKKDLLIVINHLTRPDGYINRKIIVDDPAFREATKFENGDIMAPIATVGIIDPNVDLFQKYISYYEKNIASDYFLSKMDRNIFYMIQCEHYWQPIYLATGEWKKAFMCLQTALKYGMSQDAYQTQERFDKRNPAFAPWQPNGSGSGGIIDMLLNAFYFEEGMDQATVLGCVPFEYIIQNGKTSIKNLFTSNATRINIEVNKIDNQHCRLEISSPESLPSRIRIPEYFKALPENKNIKSLKGNIFQIKKDCKNVFFVLSKAENF